MSALRRLETAPTVAADVATVHQTVPSGARSGAMLGAASFFATVANYVFLLAAGRFLGDDAYGGLAALLGLLTLVLLPTGAVQLAISREIARKVAAGDADGAAAFTRAVLRLGLIATLPLLGAALALAVPAGRLLKIDSTGTVLVAALGLVAAFVLPITLGALLGYQRFRAVAGLYVLPFALRLLLLAVVVAAGFRLGGAVFAAVAGGIATAAIAVVLLRAPLRASAHASRPSLTPFLRYLVPVVCGLIGIAILTNVDLLVVKARFAPEDAGDYAAASAFARVAFFLPATILTVLFPRTAARQARGEETLDILGRALIVTGGFCALLTLAYAATAQGLLQTTYGTDFAQGGPLLWPMTVAISLYSLANVLVGFHLSRGESRYAWIVGGAVIVQISLLAFLPLTLHDLIWTNAAVAASLLVAHELLVGSSLPALRAGIAAFQRSIHVTREMIAETALVLAGAAVLASILTWPLVTELGSAFIGTEGSDSSGTVSWLWRLEHESGYHLLGVTRHALTGAPFGWVEDNGLNLNWLLPYYPGYLAAKVVGEVAAYNLVVLSGYGLSAATMYLLSRYLGCTRLVAAWAGLVFAMFPWHVERAQHASLLHLEVLVLVTLALVAAAERPTGTRFLLVGLAILACWLTSGYFGVMASIGSVFFATAAWLSLRETGTGIRILLGIAGAAASTTVFMALAGTGGGIGNGAGLGRSLLDLSVYGLRAQELVVPTGSSVLFGHWTRPFHEGRFHGSNVTEISNYAGLVTIGFAVAWLVVSWRRRRSLDLRVRIATSGLTGLALAALAFSTPSPIGVFGHLWSWTPARLLWEVVPAVRVPSRWIALLMTALVPLAALGLQAAYAALARRARASARARLAPTALVIAACLASALELAVHRSDPIFRTVPVPPQYEAVERTPAGILAEYPLERSDIDLLWQREHGRPLVSGAPDGTYADEVQRSLVDPRQPGTAAALALLGVTTAVGSTDAPANFASGFRLIRRFPNGSSVWDVSAAPAPAFASLPSPDFLEPGGRQDGFVRQPLTGKTGTIDLWAPVRRIVTLRFDARSTSEKQWSLRIGGIDSEATVPVAGHTPVSVIVDVPAGYSRLHLTVDPDPDRGEYPLELSAPRAEPASGQPQLQAESVTAAAVGAPAR
jgi:O-antigen/teichoic acid export membrane protein